MVSTFTPNKAIEQPAFNDYVDSWDVPVNADWGIIDLALGGLTSFNAAGLSGNQVLTTAQYKPLKIRITGLPAAAVNLRVPSGVGGIWVVRNDTTGGFAITIDSAAGGAAVTIPASQNTLVTCDGTATGMFVAINTPGAAAGSTTQVQYNNAGVLGGSANLTFDGTTLTTVGLATTGNTVLGNAAGDTLALNGTAIAAANGIAINTTQLVLNSAGTKVSIGTASPGASMLTVAGAIESTSGGFVFPDGSTQTSAATSPTGSVIHYVGGTPPTGWVLAFGTIGGTLSGATNRANADTATLFALIWNNWANGQAAVSGGRGANAAADFAASKTIAMPDIRGRFLGGLDNIGGIAASRITATTMTPNGTTMGATGGAQTHIHTITNLPSTTMDAGNTTQLVEGNAVTNPVLVSNQSHTHANVLSTGSSDASSSLPPALLMNVIVKL